MSLRGLHATVVLGECLMLSGVLHFLRGARHGDPTLTPHTQPSSTVSTCLCRDRAFRLRSSAQTPARTIDAARLAREPGV